MPKDVRADSQSRVTKPADVDAFWEAVLRRAVGEGLLRGTCEVCGAKGKAEMPHVRKVADRQKIGRRG